MSLIKPIGATNINIKKKSNKKLKGCKKIECCVMLYATKGYRLEKKQIKIRLNPTLFMEQILIRKIKLKLISQVIGFQVKDSKNAKTRFKESKIAIFAKSFIFNFLNLKWLFFFKCK